MIKARQTFTVVITRVGTIERELEAATEKELDELSDRMAEEILWTARGDLATLEMRLSRKVRVDRGFLVVDGSTLPEGVRWGPERLGS